MRTSETDAVAGHDAGVDAVAVKPAESDVSRAAALPVDAVTIDFEGREHVPGRETLAGLADRVETLRVTVPVRADGFDPLGDDSAMTRIPAAAKLVVVAGHPAYLSATERSRAIPPRFEAAVERAEDPWVGTEGVEAAARATGASQFLLLSPSTSEELRSLRASGFEGDLAVYAPTVRSERADVVLDAVGAYVARRGPVAEALPEGSPTDARARGRARSVLLEAAAAYALVGSVATVEERVEDLRAAGADHVVGHPARGLDAFGLD